MSGQMPRKRQTTNPDLRRRGQSEQTQQVKITDNLKTAHPDGFPTEIHQTSDDGLIPVLHKTVLEIEGPVLPDANTEDITKTGKRKAKVSYKHGQKNPQKKKRVGGGSWGKKQIKPFNIQKATKESYI